MPRFHEEELLERPSTAPNGSPPSTVWTSAASRLRRNPLKGGPPVSFRMVRPSTAQPGARPSSQGGDSVAGSFQFTRGHSRSNSIRSDGGKGFKDLLDAQSEIKPSDFKTRVKAAGVRDYGEDVAERNLGENGFNLDSSHVQAFYAHASTRASFTQHRSSGSLYISDIRARSLNSSSQNPMPIKTGVFQSPRLSASDGPFGYSRTSSESIARRRQSVNTYMPTNQHGENGTAPNTRSGLRQTSHTKKPSLDLPALPPLELKAPVILGPPKMARPATSHAARIPRDSLVLAKEKKADHLVDDAISVNPLPNERSFPLKSLPRSHRGSVASPASPTKTPPRKRHSIQTLQSSSIANRESVFDTAPLAYPRNKLQQATKHEHNEVNHEVVPPAITSIDFDVAATASKAPGPTSSHC